MAGGVEGEGFHGAATAGENSVECPSRGLPRGVPPEDQPSATGSSGHHRAGRMPDAGGHGFAHAQTGQVPSILRAEDVSDIGADAAAGDQCAVRRQGEAEPTAVPVGDGIGDEGAGAEATRGKFDDQQGIVGILDDGHAVVRGEGDGTRGACSLKHAHSGAGGPEPDSGNVAQGKELQIGGHGLDAENGVGARVHQLRGPVG